MEIEKRRRERERCGLFLFSSRYFSNRLTNMLCFRFVSFCSFSVGRGEGGGGSVVPRFTDNVHDVRPSMSAYDVLPRPL